MALMAGLVIHSFIIGVNVSDWWRGRSVTPVDLIVTSLGISRMCTQSTITIDVILLMFLQSYPHSEVLLDIMATLYVFFTSINIWLTSLLSVVLCLKISNLHTRLFLYLRRMILHRTGCLIAASGIVSIINSLLNLLLAIKKIHEGRTHNSTIHELFIDCMDINSVCTFTAGAFFPLLLYFTSSVLLFVSLYHHTTRMKMSSNLSINLETYYSAMKLVSFTFMYNTVYLFSHITSLLYHHLYCYTSPWIHVVLDFLPVLHSSYLIYRTAKLRNQMSKVLHNVMDYLFQRKTTENIENIEIVDR
ncbi:hypothetical protein GDO81_025895 [Engystomops pustulosus]|uniref:Taste receptor type 2 n=1 Tax=Engystomops pustulosus TaxID=76066 RepID=A0AAV6ZG89_ENGPU|nr:hypothetical protein GDO81_025895 [Engystomops pustulosus]